MASYDDTATVSGSVVGFNNGADDVPTKSLVVTIPPTLSGVSSVTETQTGKNLIDIENFVQRSGYNNLSFSVSNNVLTLSGYDAGGRFGCFNIPTKIGVSYTVKYTARANVQNVRVVESDTEPTNWINGGYAVGVNSAYTYTASKPWVQVWIEMTADNTTVTDLQLEVGSSASTFEPYHTPTVYTASLGRTIYGGQADIVNGVGKETYGNIVFDGSNDEVWQKHGSIASWFYIDNAITDGYVNSAENDFMICNLGTQAKYASVAQLSNGQFAFGLPSPTTYRFVFKNTDFTEVADFKALTAVGDNYIVFENTTPEDFTFSGQEVPTMLGVNNFWSEQGDTELTYYKSGYGFTSVTVHKETPEGEPVEQTAYLHKVIYGGTADVIRGTCEPKNLFDLNNANLVDGYISTTSFNTGNSKAKTIYIPINANTTYTVSKTAGQRFQIATSDVIPTNGATYTERVAQSGQQTSLTITSGSNDKYLWAWVFLQDTDTGTLADMLSSVQIEKGSSASEYVPGFTQFTFPPISMSTDEGENTLFANEGDSAITYRKAVD